MNRTSRKSSGAQGICSQSYFLGVDYEFNARNLEEFDFEDRPWGPEYDIVA